MYTLDHCLLKLDQNDHSLAKFFQLAQKVKTLLGGDRRLIIVPDETCYCGIICKLHHSNHTVARGFKELEDKVKS